MFEKWDWVVAQWQQIWGGGTATKPRWAKIAHWVMVSISLIAVIWFLVWLWTLSPWWFLLGVIVAVILFLIIVAVAIIKQINLAQ